MVRDSYVVARVAIIIVSAGQGAQSIPALLPSWEFSWDTLPVWGSGQGATDFNSTVASYYALNFGIMWTQGTCLGPADACPSNGWTTPHDPGYSTWEDGIISDLAKVHRVRPAMPGFAYYGFYGCCSPYNNAWYGQFNASSSSELWLHDDDGRAVNASTEFKGTYVYNLCNPAMIEFYKETILRRFMESDHVHGVFFDEVDSFVEGGFGNIPWAGQGGPTGYNFSDARKAELTECFISAMEDLVQYITSKGKFPIPSTNAYVKQYSVFGNRQHTALATHGGFKFVEAFCPDGNHSFECSGERDGGFPCWVCPTHSSRESCCLDQLLSIKAHADDGVPLMIHAGYPSDANGHHDHSEGENIAVCAFLIAAQKYSYVAVGKGWAGTSSFPALPLLRKQLGIPRGNATVVDEAAGVFTREFEHLSLALNVSAWTCRWDWH